METKELIYIGIFFLFCVYILSCVSFCVYTKRKIAKAELNQDLKLLRNLEKEIVKGSGLYWIFPMTTDSFLLRIKETIEIIHQNNENLIGIDLDFLLIQAKDEYENLNGLTTSEDQEVEPI